VKLRFEPATQEVLCQPGEWHYDAPRFGSRRIVLDVAEFNVRAAKVYERAGFRVTGRRLRDDVPFVDMELAE
jgi:RimJ/RimL family protein N-acetyltransferase